MRDTPLILIVEDNPASLEIMQLRLEASGYQVITATDGEADLLADQVSSLSLTGRPSAAERSAANTTRCPAPLARRQKAMSSTTSFGSRSNACTR